MLAWLLWSLNLFIHLFIHWFIHTLYHSKLDCVAAGCLPSLATIPVFIGLYNSLTNVANSGRLDSQGFFWLPSLAGPTSLAARQAGQRHVPDQPFYHVVHQNV